jgi:hypothetical protein|tara:strand:+ start:929 stop:1258 length:330 start_codon:yes stop_codon:yes gene_type:complete
MEQLQQYVTKDLLVKLNNKAYRRKSNRQLEPKWVERLPNLLSDLGKDFKQTKGEVRYPLVQSFLHNDVEMRCCFATHEGDHFYLDVSFADYKVLPVIDLSDANANNQLS